MGNKEKYINYVVDDLIKKTWLQPSHLVVLPYPSNFKLSSQIPNIIMQRSFINHVAEKYGVNKSECEEIFGIYKVKLNIAAKEIYG